MMRHKKTEREMLMKDASKSALVWQATVPQHCSTKKPGGTHLTVMRVLGHLTTSSHPLLIESCPWGVDSPILPGCNCLQLSELPRWQRKPLGREKKRNRQMRREAIIMLETLFHCCCWENGLENHQCLLQSIHHVTLIQSCPMLFSTLLLMLQCGSGPQFLINKIKQTKIKNPHQKYQRGGAVENGFKQVMGMSTG